jgi:hypothetical protein
MRLQTKQKTVARKNEVLCRENGTLPYENPGIL